MSSSSSVAYHISLQGRLHKTADVPCQDAGRIVKRPGYSIAIVADGVGSSRYSGIASRLAVRTASGLLTRQLPRDMRRLRGNTEETAADTAVESVLTAALHGAGNAIENYADKHECALEDLQTTITMAVLYHDGTLYYGNAGDSGAIGLPALVSGAGWQVLTTKDKDETGCVYSIPKFRRFEVGRAPFPCKAVLCMTDGLLDSVAPEVLSGTGYPVNTPFANLFVMDSFAPGRSGKAMETAARTRMINYLSSADCGHMTDDLSAAVVLLPELAPARMEDIAWEEPAKLDPYRLKARELSIYSKEIAGQLFSEFIYKMNPDIEEQAAEVLRRRYLSA